MHSTLHINTHPLIHTCVPSPPQMCTHTYTHSSARSCGRANMPAPAHSFTQSPAHLLAATAAGPGGRGPDARLEAAVVTWPSTLLKMGAARTKRWAGRPPGHAGQPVQPAHLLAAAAAAHVVAALKVLQAGLGGVGMALLVGARACTSMGQLKRPERGWSSCSEQICAARCGQVGVCLASHHMAFHFQAPPFPQQHP